MKTVWILNHYAKEPGIAGGTRHYSLACNIPKYGWQAFIIASCIGPNPGCQLSPSNTVSFTPLKNAPGGILWIRTPAYTGNGIGRVMNMLAYTVRAILNNNTKCLARPDIVIGSSVHPFAALAGLKIARRYRVPFIFEVRDLWPQTLIDMGRLKIGHPVTLMLQYIERFLYAKSDKIIVLLPKADKYIVPLDIPASRIYWIPNGVDLEHFPATPLPIHDSFTLMYFGAHGTANGLGNIINAMALLEKKDPNLPIRLRLVGDGPQKNDLMRQAKTFGLHNVSFENPVPKSCIPSLAAEADAFIFNLLHIPVFKYGISSNKLFDFMAANRPILFCCGAENNPIAEAGCGITVNPEDPEALYNAIVQIYRTPIDKRRAMGEAGRRYIERNHDYRQLSFNLANLLNVVAHHRSEIVDLKHSKHYESNDV